MHANHATEMTELLTEITHKDALHSQIKSVISSLNLPFSLRTNWIQYQIDFDWFTQQTERRFVVYKECTYSFSRIWATQLNTTTLCLYIKNKYWHAMAIAKFREILGVFQFFILAAWLKKSEQDVGWHYEVVSICNFVFVAVTIDYERQLVLTRHALQRY